MVYSNKFIVVVKSKGKVLREFPDNEVRLPFGSDYTLLLKNKDLTRKARVDVFVDGKDVLEDNSLILDPSDYVELEGFLKGTSVRNKFRFIEKTEEISNYRGDNEEDGLIEVRYVFEQAAFIQSSQENIFTWHPDWYHPPTYGNDNTVYRSYEVTSSAPVAKCCSTNDSGITVPGASTNQEFTQGYFGVPDGSPKNIIIHLKGLIRDKVSNKLKMVSKPTTVKTKVKCPTCGRTWKSSMTYCGRCSTYLH